MRVVAVALIGMSAVLPGAAGSQARDLPTRTLTRPDFTHREAFTAISGMRELRDGRIIVSDMREMRLEMIDPKTGRATPIAREGAGPGEYGTLTRLHALPGDSTLMYDARNDRYLIIDGAGGTSTRVLETTGGSRFSANPTAVDARGGLWFGRSRYAPGERRMGDTPIGEYVLRFDPATKAIDTVAVLAVPSGRMQGYRQLSAGMLQALDNKPLAPEDIAAAAPDGRLAIVRVGDFHVEWIAPDGRRVTGAPVAYAPIRVTDAEKRAHLTRQIRPGAIITQANPNPNARAMPMGAQGAPRVPRTPEVEIDDPSLTWPSVMPPFLAGAARVAPDGVLWVLRTRPHDDPNPAYELFDQMGRRIARVVLPPDSRLVGFGAGTVYLARKDADELEWLEMYRM